MTSSTRATSSLHRSLCCATTSSAPASAVRSVRIRPSSSSTTRAYSSAGSKRFSPAYPRWPKRAATSPASPPSCATRSPTLHSRTTSFRRAASIPSASPSPLLYPAPNVNGARSRNNNFRANQPIRTTTNVGVARLDHAFSTNDRVYGRFLANDTDTINSFVFPTPGVDNFDSRNDNSFYSWSATWQHTFSPTTTVEARYSYDRRKANAQSGGTDLGLAEQFGIQGTNDRVSSRKSTFLASRASAPVITNGCRCRSAATTTVHPSPLSKAPTRSSTAPSFDDPRIPIVGPAPAAACSVSTRPQPAMLSHRCSPDGPSAARERKHFSLLREPTRSEPSSKPIGRSHRS